MAEAYPANQSAAKPTGTKEAKLEAIQKEIDRLIEEREKLKQGD